MFVKYKNNNLFSETISGMKLILCIHDIDIILYKNCVFCSDLYMKSLDVMEAFH